MIWVEQEFSRIAEIGICREPFRIGMSMGAKDRQALNLRIKRTRNRPGGWITGKETIGAKMEMLFHLILQSPVLKFAKDGRAWAGSIKPRPQRLESATNIMVIA
jgi:hypothetical protein